MARVRRGNNAGLGVLMLASTVLNIGVEHIPPVTLALVAGQVAVFLGFFPTIFTSTMGVCISPYLVINHGDHRRLILGQLAHGDDMHLYFNMVSLIYKGIKLERMFGSPYFAYLTAVFTGLTSVTFVAIGQGMSHLLNDQAYIINCAVGFSGVLFALKVLATEYSEPGTQYFLGAIPVPSKYIFWVELFAISLATPNASFIGHLAGILVGLAYTRGPLKVIMDAFLKPGSDTGGHSPSTGNSSGFRRNRRGFSFGSSNAARSSNSNSNRFNQGGLTEEAQIREAMQQSRQNEGYNYQTRSQEPAMPQSSPYNNGLGDSPPPDLNDLRNRRAQFYQR